MWTVDWAQLFVPSGSLVELFVRGTIIYLSALGFLRILRRQGGEFSRADLLFITVIADAAQNGMAGEYRSVTEGVVLIGTIFFWNYALDWLGFHFVLVHKLLEPPPLLVVRNGRPLRRNLRSELMSLDDLNEQLREQGISDLERVRRAYIEADGKLSVVHNGD
jgi:uncharacterized membrane protein YcaP (DUF421 family)